MDFSVDFFRDEVRNGFYIPTAIKQAWAASLTVLSEIDRICSKYGIAYFADWGTILGAVRHGGFVPWDDDLDICMKRDDYIRFREVADQELPEEFVIHDYERKENHWLFLSRVVNSSQTCFRQKHLEKYHNFPYMSAVDIFVQDYLYKDETKERERCEEIKRLIAVADGIVEGRFRDEIVERELQEVEKRYDVVIDRRSDACMKGIVLYRIAEQQMARVQKNEADSVGQIFPWILKGHKGLPKKYYEKFIRLPFENTTIPVPACYDAVLRSRYGNYLEIHKVWTGHDYPYFEKQREQLQAAAGYKLPEFTFTPDMLAGRSGRDVQEGDSLKNMVAECMNQLGEMTNQLICLTKEAVYEEVLSLLPECQQLSVDLGTLLEEVMGEENESCRLMVEKIQEYCDALYAIFLDITGQSECEENLEENLEENVGSLDYAEGFEIGRMDTASTDEADGVENIHLEETETACLDMPRKVARLIGVLQEMDSMVQEQILNRKEILFVTTGFKEWRGFESIYHTAIADEQCDVSVVPLPVLFKNPLGRVTVSNEEIEKAVYAEEYPAEIVLTPWTKYDLKLHHPDQIYIQDPYDGENPCLTVPPQYYAKALRKYTEELIYIPPFEVDEFTEKDYNDIYNLKHYVTAPGVIYADTVIVQSENMKQQYVQKLTEFAGEDTRAIWEEKIKPMGLPISDYKKSLKEHNDASKNGSKRDKKRILYCIGLNELSEHKNILECVRERLEMLKENRDALRTTVVLYPTEADEWKKIDTQLTTDVMKLIGDYENESWCEFYDLKKMTFDLVVDEHDAYYGSATPLVPLFVHEKKAVMISGCE